MPGTRAEVWLVSYERKTHKRKWRVFATRDLAIEFANICWDGYPDLIAVEMFSAILMQEQSVRPIRPSR